MLAAALRSPASPLRRQAATALRSPSRSVTLSRSFSVSSSGVVPPARSAEPEKHQQERQVHHSAGVLYIPPGVAVVGDPFAARDQQRADTKRSMLKGSNKRWYQTGY